MRTMNATLALGRTHDDISRVKQENQFGKRFTNSYLIREMCLLCMYISREKSESSLLSVYRGLIDPYSIPLFAFIVELQLHSHNHFSTLSVNDTACSCMFIAAINYVSEIQFTFNYMNTMRNVVLILKCNGIKQKFVSVSRQMLE